MEIDPAQGTRRGVVWRGNASAWSASLASIAVLALAAPVLIAPAAMAGSAAAARNMAASSTVVAPGNGWQQSRWGDVVADLLSLNGSSKTYEATRDPGSLYTVTSRLVRAPYGTSTTPAGAASPAKA